MHRRTYLAALGAAASATLAGCGASDASTDIPAGTPQSSETPASDPTDTPAGPATTLANTSFENGLDAWQVGRDLPEDPGNPGQPVDASVSTTTARANTGASSVEMTVDGSADDGAVWVVQVVDFADAARLAVHCYSPEQTFNALAELAVYAGPMPEGGLREAVFDRSEQTGDHAGWKRYEYPVDFSGTGVVAVGMNVVWETTVTRWFDDVGLLGEEE
ncbi:hypothetical protein [Haloarcula onubensis]|uniref:Uncharacterized protein n=1 Tax=Haloarcula onubensis TaxID=2950539 RepID=A0ABU2FPC4_9EURY|nr:hypothetical protein [Halomicroarcula sp. S3CR25-11]MDS0282612.1 hypothetical protein [Halomicroarcula sp. S3CR25-11]